MIFIVENYRPRGLHLEVGDRGEAAVCGPVLVLLG